MDNLLFTALLFLMMEVLSMSARISHRDRVKKRTQVLCVGGKWFQVGSYRFWQRSTCGQRRHRALPSTGPPPKTTPYKKILRDGRTSVMTNPTTIDFDLILPSAERGPKRNDSYDPNFGYEPYWELGDWVFDKDPYPKDMSTHMCGIKCPQVYTEYGKICARNKYFHYQTFENYCQLRNKDCSNLHRWMVLYSGSCYRKLEMYERMNQRNRAKYQIELFMKLYTDHEKYVGLCKDCKL